MSDNLSPMKQVPAELWMYMFELLDSSKDLNNVLRTCRSFHNFAIRALHRSITWKTPRAFAHNMPFWRDEAEVMLNNVECLDLRISTLPDHAHGTFVDTNGWTFTRSDPDPLFRYAQGPWVEEDPNDIHNMPIIRTIKFYKIQETFATSLLYAALVARLTSFTKLHTLRLQNLFFTDELLGALHILPGLRTLHIESCFFPRRQNVTARDYSKLPITSLTMVNLRRQVLRGGHHGEDENHIFAEMDEDINYALDIASAHNLRTLRVDSTADVFALVYRKRDHGAYSYKIPEQLTHLYVMRKRTVRNTVQPMFHSEQLFPIAAYAVMERCPTLTTVSLGYPLPKHHTFPKHDSLPNLTHCEGSLDTIAALATGRPLRALNILRSDAATEGILETLARLSQEHVNLQMLSIHCKTWDLEILDAITQLFPGLRKLRVTFDARKVCKPWDQVEFWARIGSRTPSYELAEDMPSQQDHANGQQSPDEDTIVSFGPHYLYRLQDLNTVEIFAIPFEGTVDHPPFLFDSTFESIDEELRNLVIPWNRYCKSLRKVQLYSGYVLQRGYEGGTWDMHKLYEILESSDFKY
ncbi:hypothetical protein BC835DRAFT_986343 [Cytidiella melzeri]|nr:hypothetical protein BC835DRAFT_986343 [Cytidiella melzeri]